MNDQVERPLFGGRDVGRLFGYSDEAPVRRWVESGCLEATAEDYPGRAGPRWRISPEAVLRFVREHPDAYEWDRIADERLRAEAERVEKADPLVALDCLAHPAEATAAEVQAWARKGLLPVVRRKAADGGKGTRLLIRRSKIGPTAEAMRAHRRRTDPLAVLHGLIEAPAPKSEPARGAPISPTRLGAQGRADVTVIPNAISVPGRRPQCERCSALMVAVENHDRQAVWSCLSCGHENPVGARHLPADAGVAS